MLNAHICLPEIGYLRALVIGWFSFPTFPFTNCFPLTWPWSHTCFSPTVNLSVVDCFQMQKPLASKQRDHLAILSSWVRIYSKANRALVRILDGTGSYFILGTKYTTDVHDLFLLELNLISVCIERGRLLRRQISTFIWNEKWSQAFLKDN